MSKDKTTMLIWSATFFLVVLMLGAAVYIVMANKAAKTNAVSPLVASQVSKNSAPVAVIEQPIIKEPAPVIEPKRQVDQPKTSPVPHVPLEPEIVTDAQEDALNKRPVVRADADLDLSNLAGTLHAEMKLDGVNKNKMPLRYTCYRNNVSPPLSWSNTPSGTKSFAVFLEKANQGEDVAVSWALFNIPADKTSIIENVPSPQYDGMRFGANHFNNAAYAGPCEPKDKQRYRVRILALDKVLDTPIGASRNELIRAMNGHVIDMAEIIAEHYM